MVNLAVLVCKLRGHTRKYRAKNRKQHNSPTEIYCGRCGVVLVIVRSMFE